MGIGVRNKFIFNLKKNHSYGSIILNRQFIINKNQISNYYSYILIFLSILTISSFISPCIYAQSQLRSADYYFDSVNGNDSNPGTYVSPKQTLSALAGLLSQSNIIIALRDSMYYRTIADNSGDVLIMSGDNIRLTNYWYNPTEDYGSLPKIRYSKEITGWSNYSGNIWMATGMINTTLMFTYGSVNKIDSTKYGDTKNFFGIIDNRKRVLC